MTSLLDQLAQPVGTPPPARPSPKRGLVAGTIATIGVIAAKAKMFALLALKFGTTAWTMVLAAWLYSTQVGWPFAALLVGLILIHEIGHGLAARRVGIRVGAPVFIPFLGAFIAMRDRPRDRWEDFVIAAGGPLIGGLASIACLVASMLVDGTPHLLLHGGGALALVINVFNLLPVWILDGSKMLPLVRTRDAIIGLSVVAAALVTTALAGHFNTMPAVVAVVAAWQVAMVARKQRHPRAPTSLLEQLEPVRGPIAASPDLISPRRRAIGALVYFGMLAGYAAILQIAGV